MRYEVGPSIVSQFVLEQCFRTPILLHLLVTVHIRDSLISQVRRLLFFRRLESADVHLTSTRIFKPL